MTFKCKYEGLILSTDTGLLISWDVHNIVRLILFLMGLGYTFLGVAVISDVFMAGIEKITSAKKRVTDKKTGRTVTVYVWNATVANLTLMALGSSAPEILLSLIEITTGDFFLGPLGAGTIVGSAAFNLLVISAVCVCAIPDGEIRFIKEVPVYAITASFSVFAYLWLMFILLVTSPDVTEIWEAVVTLLFCPLFVFLAFLADRGYFTKGGRDAADLDHHVPETIADDVSPEEMKDLIQQVRNEHGQSLSDEQVLKIMKAQYFNSHSRAYYRHAAIQNTIGGKHVQLEQEESALSVIQKATETTDDIDAERAKKTVILGFPCAEYKWPESIGKGVIHIMRAGNCDVKVSVKCVTKDGTAKASPGGNDYNPVDATVTFEVGETDKEVPITILDDTEFEQTEFFTVEISDAKCEQSGYFVNIPTDRQACTVKIADDDQPGDIRFEVEDKTVAETQGDSIVEIRVERYGGSNGEISCKYRLDAMKSGADVDYADASGVVTFAHGQLSTIIPVTIKGRKRIDAKTSFNVVITDATGGTEECKTKFDDKTDGGADECICHINITHENETNTLDHMMNVFHCANKMAKHKKWARQFRNAITGDEEDEEGGDGGEGLLEGGEGGEDGGGGSSKLDFFIHVISIPWKLLFAFVPPVDYCGGWACFYMALVFIGGVTAIVGDMANLVGCCFDVLPETAAITFVALGTSLPDTFASKTAAQVDPYADASIGNVTGSNAVNVFLGIGIAWAVAAFYWQSTDLQGNTAYAKAFLELSTDQQKNVKDFIDGGTKAVYMTPGGTIWFNLMVFCVNAFAALQHLFARRKKWGGELGGPKKGCMGQYFSAAFLVGQWFIYVAASIAFARSGGMATTYGQLTAPDVTTPIPTTR